MRIWILALMSLCYTGADAQELNDGPYVIYRENMPFVKLVNNGLAAERPILDGRITVSFAGNPEWNFNVDIRKDTAIEPSETLQPEKLFFVSDVEGEFGGFRGVLIAAGVMDEKYNWTFGKGHLVLCGDLFDRGEQVPETIWLIYKLEALAKSAGGYVHTILGNHDIMNLSGDLRYVQPKYFESAKLMGLDYLSLFGVDSELGRWLRSKNTIEKIGGNLCAHAGIAPQLNKLGMSLQQINDKCRPYYDKARSTIEDAGDDVSIVFSGSTSAFWYRGYFHEPKATEAEVNETLRLYGVKRIVVGHTIVPGNVGFYYGGKVLGLDVNTHQGDHQGALFETGKWYKMNDKGKKTALSEH